MKLNTPINWFLLTLLLLFVGAVMSKEEATRDAFIGWIFAIGGLAIYFSPTAAAVTNSHPDAQSIGIVNLFLGWTFVGWVVCLAWAYKKPAR